MSAPPLSSLLSDTHLALLRAGYDRDVAYAGALGALSTPVPGAVDWVTSAGSYFFKGKGHMSAERRELCVISMMTVLKMPDQLAIHVYWGLMEGLSIDQIGNALFLGGDYGGIACFQTALRSTQATLVSLQKQAGAAQKTIAERLGSVTEEAGIAAITAAACKELLPVNIVVGTLSGAVARTMAGMPA